MQKLGARQVLSYSFGSFAAGMFFALNNFTLPFYLRQFTNSDILIGYLSSTRSFEQSFSQPLIGAWSDRTWTRLGRRAPFFLLLMPLSAVFLVANGLLPGDPARLPFVVGAVFLFSLLFNLGYDPYIALLADVTPSEQRGTVNGVAGGLFGNFATIVFLAFAFLWIESHIGWLFFLVAAGLVVGFLIVALGVREKKQLISREKKEGVSIPILVDQMRQRFAAKPRVIGLSTVVGLVVFGIGAWFVQASAEFAPRTVAIGLGLFAGILIGVLFGLGLHKLFVEGFTRGRLARLPILLLAGLLTGGILGGLVGGLVGLLPGLVVYFLLGLAPALTTAGLFLVLVGVPVGTLAGWLMCDYIVGLYGEQREAVKLLGVRFLYQFGINAALPFLTLFVATEIGTRGWPELIARFPLLAATPLAHPDAAGLSQLVAGFLFIMTMLFAFPCGWLGDKLGKKRVFAFGLAVTGVTALFAAFATTISQLLFYVIFLGLGNAAISILFFPYLSDLVPASRIGEFQGLSATAETGGVFLSAVTAGALIDLNLFHLHYRTIFVITSIFLLLGFIAVQFVRARLAEAPSASLLTGPAQG